MHNLNNSEISSSLDTESSTSRSRRPYVSTLLGGRSRRLSWSPTRGAIDGMPSNKVEDGTVYRMLRQKGATHDEAYKRQKGCTERNAAMRRVASAGGSSNVFTVSHPPQGLRPPLPPPHT